MYSSPGVLGNNSSFNNMSATDLENLIRASNLDGMQANSNNPLQVAAPQDCFEWMFQAQSVFVAAYTLRPQHDLGLLWCRT